MTQLIEFKNREISFLEPNCTIPDGAKPLRGYQITTSQNYEELLKLLKIENEEYNSYTTISSYTEMPRLSLNPKKHWPEFREWIKIRDCYINSVDFILDFDTTSSITGLKEAWEDVQTALNLLPDLIGEQTKYLTIWFSGNKGFHILGKCTKNLTPQQNIDVMQDIANKLKIVCPSIDLSIYQVHRLRKLLGSRVYSSYFGKTRVIPILNQQEFEELINALENDNIQWLLDKPLKQLGGTNLELYKYYNEIKKGQGD